MALGGGTYTVQNKVLPGSYINFISVNRMNPGLSARGFAAMGLELDWGIDGEVFTVTGDTFRKNSMQLFGYDYSHEKMKGLRDLFLHADTLYAYRLNSGKKATNTYATAKCSGIRGNDLKVVIAANADDEMKFDVSLYFGNNKVFDQTVTEAAELSDNEYVTWAKDVVLETTTGEALENGSNETVDAAAHQEFLDKIESYSFNVLGAVTEANTIKQLYTNFTKRMIEEVGAKFQTVLHQYDADYEGVINVKNDVKDADASKASLVYWTTGFEASLGVHQSGLNKAYDGEFTVDTAYTQVELMEAMENGQFAFHNVNGEVHVLEDINSMVTVTEEKGDIFKENQVIRVIHQIAADTAFLFNTKYLGIIPNNESGRISLWSDIVKIHEQLQKIGAIEDFNDQDIVISQGGTRKSVVIEDAVTVSGAMSKLYMTVTVA